MTVAVAAPGFQIPEARSLSSMQADVLDFLSLNLGDPALEQLARRSINLAIDDINSDVWHDIVGYQDMTLVEDEATYSLHANVGRPRRMEIQDTSYQPQTYLTYLPADEFSIEFARLQAGTPKTYSIAYETRSLFLDRKPTSAYIGTYPYARLWFFRKLPHLHGGSDAMVAPAIYAAYAVHYATERLAGIRAPGKYMMAREMKRSAELKLKRMDTEQLTDYSHPGV